ncbi:MAG: GNAT family N-acetyltransferase [Pikeienuella sp.]
MTIAPTIETERLILRPNRAEDFEAYAAFYATERATLRGGVKSRDEAWVQFAAEIGHWTLRGYGFWAVEEKATGAYVGQVGCYYPEGWAQPEIGWLMMAGFEGKGYAYEAALCARAYAYDVLGWEQAASCISVGNDRSIRLAERMGAVLDRMHPRDGKPDQYVYIHPAPGSASGAALEALQ